jgi:hypothetical protein
MMGKVQSAVLRIWTERTGAVAARHYLLALTSLPPFLIISLFMFAAFLVASLLQVPALHVAGFVLLAVDVVIHLFGLYHLRQFHQAASRFLGVHVGWNDPPSSHAKFVEWCRDRGIEPGSDPPR